jgi:Flp pilus assembly protein CpaB
MKPKTVVPLVVGLGIGFFAIKMGVDMVQRAKGSQGEAAVVIMTSKPIEVANRITEAMLTTTKVAPRFVPTGAFSSTQKAKLVGRVTAMTIPAGVPITAAMLAAPGSEPGLRAIIPAGFRAVSVSVTEDSSVGGFIMPGSRVDVSAVGRDGVSKLILSDVEVGAVGQSMSEVGSDGAAVRIAKSVTLFVRPEQVGTLHAYTGNYGKIRLAMRGDNKDPGDSMWSRVLEQMRTPVEPSKPAETPKPVVVATHFVDVVRGEDVQRYEFEPGGVMHRSEGSRHGKEKKE